MECIDREKKNVSMSMEDDILPIYNVLAHDYLNMYLIDIVSDTVKVIKQELYQIETVEPGELLSFSYETALEKYVRDCVWEKDQEYVLKSGNLENVIEALKEAKCYKGNYRSNFNGKHYFQFNFTKLDEHRIFVGFRNTDVEVIEAQKNYSMVEALSRDYLNILVINVNDKTAQIQKLEGFIIAGYDKKDVAYSYDEIIGEYISQRVYCEDQERVRKQLSMKAVLQALEENDKCVSSYRILEDGQIHYLEYKYLKLEDGRIIVGFRNIDLELKKEQENSAIVKALCHDFVNVFLVNRITRMVKIQKLSAYIRESRAIKQDEEYSYDYFVSALGINRVYFEERKEFLEKINFEFVKREIDENGEFSYNFRIQDTGNVHNYQAKYVPLIGTDEIIVGFRNIDNIVRQQQANEELEELLIKSEEDRQIVDVLATEYVAVYKIFVKDRTIAIIRETGSGDLKRLSDFSERISYKECYEQYLEKIVHPEDVEKVSSAARLEKVIEKLKNKNEYTFNYRTVNEGLRYFQFKYTSLEDGNILLGFKDISNIVEKEIQYREKIEEANKVLIAEKAAFRDTLERESLLTVVSDITDGLIIEPIIDKNGRDYLAELGFSVPAPYDEEGKKFVEVNQVEFITEGGEKCFIAEEVRKTFEVKRAFDISEFYLRASDTYIKILGVMSINPVNGHIICNGIVYDITEEKKKETKLLYMSHIDELTGLFNRNAYEEKIKSISRGKQSKKNQSAEKLPEDMVFFTIDLNGLKMVNDTIGHQAGDELIKGAGECLKNAFDKLGDVYRVGGDEFMVIGCMSNSEIENALSELEKQRKAWNKIDNLELKFALGYAKVSEFPNEELGEIIKKSDKRMYESKRLYYEKHFEERRNQW